MRQVYQSIVIFWNRERKWTITKVNKSSSYWEIPLTWPSDFTRRTSLRGNDKITYSTPRQEYYSKSNQLSSSEKSQKSKYWIYNGYVGSVPFKMVHKNSPRSNPNQLNYKQILQHGIIQGYEYQVGMTLMTYLLGLGYLCWFRARVLPGQECLASPPPK